MDCWCVKPLGEVRGGLAWKLGARWQAGSGTRSEVFQGWCSLPGLIESLLALGKCRLGAGEFVLVLGSGGSVIHPC